MEFYLQELIETRTGNRSFDKITKNLVQKSSRKMLLKLLQLTSEEDQQIKLFMKIFLF
jgi:hypothetical protein